MSFQVSDVEKLLDEMPLTADQVPRAAAIRSAAKRFAVAVLQESRASAEQTLSLRRLEESLYFALAGIRREPTDRGRWINDRAGLLSQIGDRIKPAERRRLADLLGVGAFDPTPAEESEESGNGKA